jgi:hypothetical protein
MVLCGCFLALVQLPEPDGMLHVYALPVGQGDSHVFQCPSGALSIIDLGTSDSSTAGFWFTPELRAFFQVYPMLCHY